MKWKKIVSAFAAGSLIISSVFSGNLIASAADEPKPVLEVSFDNNTAEDESGNQNNGIVKGQPEYVTGKYGKAIHLINSTNREDEALQYVNFGQLEDLRFSDGDFSVMFWYKADHADKTEGAIIGNKQWKSGGNRGFTIGDMKEGVTLNLAGDDSKKRKDTPRDPSATDNNWHHIAAVIDRSQEQTMTLYIDGDIAYGGEAVKSLKDVKGSLDSSDFVLGASNKEDGTKFLGVADAYIDELKVYKESLSARQVAELGKLPERIPRTVLKVDFNDKTANDLSGQGNDGIVEGNPEFTEGVNGKAIHLVNSQNREDEARQYVNFGQPEDLKFGNDSFSIMFWYKASGASTTEGAIIGNKYWISGKNPGFTIGDMKEGITFNMNTVGCERRDTGRYSSATDDSWHHIAAVADREDTKTMSLYIDGEKMGKSVDTSKLLGSIDAHDFLLGASNKEDGSKFLAVDDAYVDELSVYNYALPEAEIKDGAKQYFADIQLQKIKKQVEGMVAGERYDRETIADMLDKIEATQKALEEEDADKNQILDAFMKEYENFMNGNPAKMSFHLISDTHLVSNTDSEEADYFKTALQDMKEINPDAQAFLTAGDNTQDGREGEMKVFYDIMDTYNPVGDEQTMIALGNHDVRGPNSSNWETHPIEPNTYWDTIYNLYMKYNSKYMPDTQGKTYYDRWIGGYHFIVLNPENSAKDTAWLTQTQLDWLEEKLSENEEIEKPVFVIIHQALNDTHRGSNNYLGFGDQDAQVKEILSRHPQTVFISGHIHNGMGTAEVMDRGYGTLVDVPSFRWNSNGITGAGMGYEVYLYETEMYMRARDFVKKKWVPEFDVSIKLPTLPALCKQIEELEQEDYTEESWSTANEIFIEALPRAEEIINLNYGNYSAEIRREINLVQAKLKKALGVLETADKNDVDVTALNMAITMAEKLEKEQQNNEVFTEKTWESVQIVLDYARALFDDSKATQKEVDDAFIELLTAINLLESNVQKIGLGTVIEGVKVILADEETLAKYTQESVEALCIALTKAEEVYADKEATQIEVNSAATELMTAVNNLLIVENGNRLDALIQKAEELLQKEDQYTADSVQALKEALTEAKEVAGNNDASKEEINDAYNALAEAMTSLERVANKAELENALNKAEEILTNTGKYTESSLEGLKEAKDVAQSVYDDKNVTQEDIAEVLKNLVNEILEVRILGDVDLDNQVDSTDAQTLLRYNAELRELSREQIEAADVNKDKAEDTRDVSLILQYVSEKITEF